MNTWNLGWIPPGLQDVSNEKLVDISSRLFEEIKKLGEQGIYFGIWNPQRDKEGKPENFEIQCFDISEKSIGDLRKALKDKILIPLNKSFIDNKNKNKEHNKKDNNQERKQTCKEQFKLSLSPELLASFKPFKPDFPSLAFDGQDDYVEIGESDKKLKSLNFTENQVFTIEVRVKVSSLQPDSEDEDNSIIEKWNGFGPYPYVIRYNNRTGKIIASQYGSENQPSDRPRLVSKKSINDGLFHHVAFVKDDSHFCLYIDGKEEAKVEVNNTKGETKSILSSPLYFGCRGGYRNYFKGEISEVRIWKKSLECSQIKKYASTQSKNEVEEIIKSEVVSDLVGYWSFCLDDNIAQPNNSRRKQDNTKSETQEDDDQLVKFSTVQNKVTDSNHGKLHGEPAWIQYRDWSPIETQGALKSCTAHAAVSLFEYFQRKESGRHIDGSRLFLYKVARNFRSLEKERYPGASIAETMAAMMMVGIPPEEYWPYHPFLVEQEPSPLCYAIARNYRVSSCFRLDSDIRAEMEKIDLLDSDVRAGMQKINLLDQIKIFITAGFPAMFGFPLDDSTAKSAKNNQGKIPFKLFNSDYQEGHAVVAIGYDDEKEITEEICELYRCKDSKDEQEKKELTKAFQKELADLNIKLPKKFLDVKDNKVTTTGAFLIRNSWGNDWGEQGYGWLPYAYVLTGLAVDWWSLLKAEWMDIGWFGFRANPDEGTLTNCDPDKENCDPTKP